MKKFLVILALLAGNSAHARFPFEPHAQTVDYAATAISKGLNSNQSNGYAIHHHNGRTRIDYIVHGAPTQSYRNKQRNFVVFLRKDGNEEHLTMVFTREPSLPPHNTPTKTEERQIHLGEICAVWRISSDSLDGKTLSCITDDGIELWSRFVTGDGNIAFSFELTSLTRRSVRPEEVNPPKDWLSLARWLRLTPQKLASMPTEYDGHEILLESASEPKASRLIRKAGAWIHHYVKDPSSRLEILTIGSRDHGLRISSNKRGGHIRLFTISQRRPQIDVDPPRDGETLNVTDTIMGESCEWFELLPKRANAGERRCLTKDGIALIAEQYRAKTVTRLNPVKFHRSKIAFKDILPYELLDPKTWGWSE